MPVYHQEAHDEPSYDKPDHYGPPTKGYLPPMRVDKEHYHPPNKDYLPPKMSPYHQGDHEAPLYDKPDHYGPPTTGYLPPMREDQKHYHPPNKEYLPPKHRDQDAHDKPDQYGPPTKDYLPSMREDEKHYHPPNKNYLPPKDSPEESGYEAPMKEYLPPAKPHYDSYPAKHYLPTKNRLVGFKPDYVPTKSQHSHDPMQHYSLPATDYTPPGYAPQLSVPTAADYLPPHYRLDLKLAESTEYPPGTSHEYLRPPSAGAGPIPGYLPPPPPPREKLDPSYVPSLKEVLAALGPPLSGPALLLPDGEPGSTNKAAAPGVIPPPPPPPPKLSTALEKLTAAAGLPDLSSPLSDYLPPKGGPALVLADKYAADAYIPPPPPEKLKDGYVPPPPELTGLLSDYLPPDGGPALVLPQKKKKRPPHSSERYIAPPEIQILDIKAKPDYIPPPLRPQIPEDVPEPPPPEAIPSELPPLERLNSQTTVPEGLEEPYIPMKTIHDVPKNFR